MTGTLPGGDALQVTGQVDAPRAALHAPPKRIPPHVLACSFATAVAQSFGEAAKHIRVTLVMSDRQRSQCQADLYALLCSHYAHLDGPRPTSCSVQAERLQG